MEASDLLADLRAHGVRVALEGGELKLRGPVHTLTAKAIAAAKAHKPAFRELLLLEAQALPAAPVEPQVLEPSSSALAVGAEHARRIKLAEELGAILGAFPSARILRGPGPCGSSGWKINGVRYSHLEALRLAGDIHNEASAPASSRRRIG